MTEPGQAAESAVESVVRRSYGRIIACLASRWRDVAAAEDALSEAFAVALRVWPSAGVPTRPEAWLLTAAHRKLIDQARRGKRHAELVAELGDLADQARIANLPDRRLALLFVCAHPAIHTDARAPLMLQTIMGLDARRIASAFLVAPTSMGQRLVRAKTKIRDAGIAFRVPEAEEFKQRLDDVLIAIYAAYGAGWDDIAGTDPRTRDLSGQAIELGRALVELLPDEPEARGLLALMLHCEARRPARRNEQGAYVPLSLQDTRLWDDSLQAEAERELTEAAHFGSRTPGRFQLEAAIQSVHAARRATGLVDWNAVRLLYSGLVAATASLGARIGEAAALSECESLLTALKALDRIAAEHPASADYQPYWATRAALLARQGLREEARQACTRAIGLSTDPAIRTFLQGLIAS